MLILGIETSCDETSAAVIRDGKEVLSNIVLSQPSHTRFGGVVPEVASRVHLKTVVPIFREALDAANVSVSDINLIAATNGPGLVGPLLVGLTFAKGLSYVASIPFVAVNHMEGHLAANLLVHPDLRTPHLSLVVSGGHTMLVEVEEFGKYTVFGQTRDDAAGEAYDKVAKLLGLGYPGGAKVDALAKQGNKTAIRFPRALIKDEPYTFSFSGLKTAVALYVEKLSDEERTRQLPDIAASFQEAVVDALVDRTVRAAQEKRHDQVTLTGGVAANSRLREALGDRLSQVGSRLFVPPMSLCTDNAAMIAAAGFFRYQRVGASEYAVNAVPYQPLTSWQ